MRKEGATTGWREALEAKKARGPILADQWLVPLYFKAFHGKEEVYPIATDKFLDKSKPQYSRPWLARELVQNFVDHNPAEPGTLNGVSITSEDISPNQEMPQGGKRFVIEGKWQFEDQTGLISPHSEKPEGRQTAGGNGIGLKQTALMMLRDFGVKKFAIEGERWRVNYNIARADEMNAEIESHADAASACPAAKVRHNWLVAEVEPSDNRGACRYTIETDDPGLIKILEEMPNFGVSRENKHLRGLDLENEHGGLKWLTSADEQGQLFINGQVMNYKTPPQEGDPHFWHGPEGVTVVLANTAYEMSVDRPPITPSQLDTYVTKFLASLDTEQLADQLWKAEHLWRGAGDKKDNYFDRRGFIVIVEEMVRRLKWEHNFSRDAFRAACQDKKYLAVDMKLSDKQAQEARSKGYVLCPDFLKEIGMPTFSEVMGEDEEIHAAEKPKPSGSELKKLAQETGMEVYFSELDAPKAEDFFKLLRRELVVHNFALTAEQESGTAILVLKIDIPEDLLFHPLARPREDSPEQQLLFFIRSAVYHGLTTGCFEDVTVQQADFVVTYATVYDRVSRETALWEKKTKRKRKGEKGMLVLKIKLKKGRLRQFQSNMEKGKADKEAAAEIDKKRAPKAGRMEGVVGAAPVGLLGGMGQKIRRLAPIAALITLLGGGGYAAYKAAPDVGAAPAAEGRTTAGEAPRGGAGKKSERGKEGRDKQEGEDELRALAGRIRAGLPLDGGDPAAREILMWLKSGKLGKLPAKEAGYLSNSALQGILSRFTARGVRPGTETRNYALDEAEQALEEARQAARRGEKFQIIETPTREELNRLGLLRMYFEVATGVKLPNVFFVFEGTGKLGINYGRTAIGLNRALLGDKFEVVLPTFVHEAAHNLAGGHGEEFTNVEEALFSAVVENITAMARRAAAGGPLMETERAMLAIAGEWEK